MVEIPEHLLKRSQAAKAKAEGGESEEGEAPSVEETAETAAPAPEALPSATPEPAAEPAAADAAATAATAAAESKAELLLAATGVDLGEEPFDAEQIRPVAGGLTEVSGARIPKWLVAAFVAIPVFAIAYLGQYSSGVKCGQAGTLEYDAGGTQKNCDGSPIPSPGTGGKKSSGPDGKALYEKNCASCHGQQGQGGTGLALSKSAGTTLLVDFPDEASQIEFVKKGNMAYADGWGAEKKPARGTMPAWEKLLKADEIEAVVKYERSLAEGTG